MWDMKLLEQIQPGGVQPKNPSIIEEKVHQ